MCFVMERTVGSAWEFLASTACFPSERSESVSVFPTNLPFAQKQAEGRVLSGTIAIFWRAKGKHKAWC